MLVTWRRSGGGGDVWGGVWRLWLFGNVTKSKWPAWLRNGGGGGENSERRHRRQRSAKVAMAAAKHGVKYGIAAASMAAIISAKNGGVIAYGSK